MATYMRNVIFVSPSMSSRIFHRLVGIRAYQDLHTRGMCTGQSSKASNDKPQFSDPEVQTILKRITGLNLEKIYRPTREKPGRPKYRLISDKKLKELQARAETKAEERLNMPPALEERKPISKILAQNPELRGLDTAKFVFTDISYGVRERDRLVVVREPDGNLRMGNWDELDRMNQVYLPRERRVMHIPELFQDKNLPNVFSADRHEMVLDAACNQFEPDAADFIRVHQRVYDDLDQNCKYDLLRSTRHFGGMAYYLVKQRRIDGLLVDIIQKNLITDAEDLIVLHHMMHPQLKSAKETKEKGLQGSDLIKTYIQHDSNQTGKLELVVQAYENEQELNSSEQVSIGS